MSINKNFVVKNGLQVSDTLVFADAAEGRVGIGTTTPKDHLLHVFGGIGVTDAYVTGIATFANTISVGPSGTLLNVVGPDNFIGVGTAIPEYLLDVHAPISTGQTALYVHGDVRVTGDLILDELNSDQTNVNFLSVSGTSTFAGIGTFESGLHVNEGLNAVGISTIENLDVLGHVATDTLNVSDDLNVSGNSVLRNRLQIQSDDSEPGRIDFYCEVNNLHRVRLEAPPHSEFSGNPNVVLPSTSGDLLVGDTTSPISQNLNTTGIVTASYFYGDGTFLDNVIRGIGIQTGGGPISYGTTILNFSGSGISTTYYDSNSGIGTIFIEGGAGANVRVSDSAPIDPDLGDLWFHSEVGRTFIYYDETKLGTGTDSFWVDAAPVNSSVLTGPVVSIGSGIKLYSSGDASFAGIATAIEFDALSDINFKENIQVVDNALDKVMSLRGVSFDWKESKETSFGVIAQEVEQVFPELVREGSPKAVNYNGLVGILIESIKEMKQEIISLNEDIQSLKKSLNN
tara:strand:+ start:7832 stop:9370 length:1539 start_codon:yes stop_codon:yes gene_type:complete